MPRKPLEYQGNQYQSVRELADAYQVDYPLLLSRLRLGWSVEEAVQSSVGEHNAVPVTYQDKEYPSMRALANELGINYARLRSRIQGCGWSVEDAVEVELQDGTPVKYAGKLYPSIAALSQDCGVDYRLLQSRINRGWDVERAVETERILVGATPVTWQGQTYPSISRIAEQLNLPETSLLRHYSEAGEIDAAVQRTIEGRREIAVTLWGVEYPSIYGLAVSFGINSLTLHAALQRGESLEDSVTRLLNTEPIRFEDREYACLSDLCAAYKIQPANVHMRLKLGMGLADAVTRPIRSTRNGQQVSYRGEEFPSRIAMCREYGISTQCVYTQMRDLDVNYMEMFDILVELKERAGLPVEWQLNYVPACIFQGKPIKTAAQLTRGFKMDPVVVYRYKAGHGCADVFEALREMQALTKPIYTIDGKIYSGSELAKRYSGFHIQRLEKYRSVVPVYPQFQGTDFTEGCIDVLALRREILAERGLLCEEAPAETPTLELKL